MSGVLYFCPGCCKTRLDDPAHCRSCGSEPLPYVPQSEAQNWLKRSSEYASRAAEAEAVLREIQENARSMADPHFRHWANATVLSYLSALGPLVSLRTGGRKMKRFYDAFGWTWPIWAFGIFWLVVMWRFS